MRFTWSPTPPPPPEDLSVAIVEGILGSARRRDDGLGSDTGPGNVARAWWICACVTQDDAPTWLMHDRSDGGLAWCRVPDGIPLADLVQAAELAGGHADPAEVVRWLRGEATGPWSGGGWGIEDVQVLDDLRARILSG